MIPFASQRSLGQDLATHLMNEHDNEVMEVAEMRGAIAQDLHGAFAEWEAQAHALTKCQNYLYSLSINPDPAQEPLTRAQYDDYISRVEDRLGLSGQPRAVIFHEKYGREHCHVVWSRIDAIKEKAVQLAFDKDKLMMVTREFARDHGLVLPDGYFKDKAERAKNSQLSLYEMHQQRATGLSKEERMEEVTDAWRASDSARAFVQALAARGYILATGKRPYVLVDLYGKMNALPKLIADKTIRTKDIRKFLGKEFPPESLPSTEEAKVLITKHRKSVEAHLKSEQRAEAMKALERSQSARRQTQEKEWKALQQHQHQQRLKLGAVHRTQRDVHRADYLAQTQHLRRERDQKRRAGLAAFLARVTGVALIQNKLHKHQDKKRLHVFMEEKAGLKEKQQQEHTGLQRRQEMQSLDMNRKIRALEQVEKRELKSLEESLKRDARVQARGGRNQIPALALELRPPGQKEDLYKAKNHYISNLARDPAGQDHYGGQETKQIELFGDFEQAEAGKTKRKRIDLESEFSRAAKGRDEEEERGSSEGPKSAAENKIKRYGRKRGRDKDLDRGR